MFPWEQLILEVMERLILNQLRAIGLVLTVLLLGLLQDFLVEVMAMQVEVMDILGLVIVLEVLLRMEHLLVLTLFMVIVLTLMLPLKPQDMQVPPQLLPLVEVMGPMLMVVRHNMEVMLLDLLIILEDMPVVLVLPIQVILVLEVALMAEDTMLLEFIGAEHLGDMTLLAVS